MMIEFKVGEHSYRAGRLDAFAQLHVSRKIAPILPKLISILPLMPKEGEAQDFGQLAEVLAPLAEVVAAMPRDDVDLVVTACLSVVQRQQGDAFFPVWKNNALMYQDIDLPVLIQVVVHVIRGSMANFIKGFLTEAGAAADPAN